MQTISPPRYDAERLTGIGQSIFTVMTRLAVEYEAVNLGQGFPDFDGPAWVVDEFVAALRSGRNQYAPMSGVLALRKSVAGYQKRFYDLEWDADEEITITAGATEALFCAMLALLNPGDEVVLFEPYYDAHHADALLAGASPVCVTLHKPGFCITADALDAAISERTRMIVLNNPHNPAGRVFGRDELNIVADVVRERDLLLLSDEVYEFLTYDGRQHIPVASLPDMRDRCITVSSTGKTFGMTGWKVGYAIASAPLTTALRKVHQFSTFAVNTPAQLAMAHALEKLEEYLPDFRAQYQQKRDMLRSGLDSSIITPHAVEGSYFMMGSIPKELGMTDVELCMHILREHRVALIPPSAFYANNDEGMSMLRFCFAKREETIREGLQRLSALSIPL